MYNTMQDGTASTDQLPPLPALPDRRGDVSPVVTADRLSAELQDGIEQLLPPRGACAICL